MRRPTTSRTIRLVATAAVAGALTLGLAASPAAAEGECVDLTVNTNPPAGAIVCTPDL